MKQGEPQLKSLTLQIQGLGNVPSFKNGRQLFLTSPRKREWMNQCIRSFESQLKCELETRGGETLTAQQQRSLIASFVPLDDSVQWIPEIRIVAIQVPNGQEGAMITIERLTNP